MMCDALSGATRSLAFVSAWRGAQTAGRDGGQCQLHDGLKRQPHQTTMDSALSVGEGEGCSSLTSTQPSSRLRHYHDSIASLLTMNVECLRLVNRDIGDRRREGDHDLRVFLSEPNLRTTLVVRRHLA
jgi:hypothetical protein